MARQDEATSAGMQGAAAGFQIGGPLGAAIGAFTGFALGSRSKRKRRRAELRQLKSDTRQAYRITADSYKSGNKTRTDIENTFRRGLATENALYASSGRGASESAQQRYTGRLSRERDLALESLNTQEAAFRNTTGYKLVENDYKYLTQINAREDQSNADVSTPTSYSIRTESIGGESFFTEEQKGMLRSYEDPDNYQQVSNTSNFLRYSESITPTMDEYFTGKFGDEQQRTDYEQTMTNRITEANRVYDQSLLETNLQNQRRQDEYNRRNDI